MMRSADRLLRLLVASRAPDLEPPLPIGDRTAQRQKPLTFVAPDWQRSGACEMIGPAIVERADINVPTERRR